MSSASSDVAVADDAPQERRGIYLPVGKRDFRQGEILTNVTQYIFDPISSEVEEKIYSFSVVFSQDCDLLQDYNSFEEGKGRQLHNILLHEAQLTSAVRWGVGGSDIWKRISQNKDERYHALEASPPHADSLIEGLPDLVVDFKQVFSIPTAELYRQCQSADGATRRCRLAKPYREHFQGRAAFYLQRVTLPDPHQIATVPKPT